MLTPEQSHNLIARLFSPVPEVRRQAARELHELHGLHAEITGTCQDSYLVRLSEYNNQCPIDEDPLSNNNKLTVDEQSEEQSNNVIDALERLYEENPITKQTAVLRLMHQWNGSASLVSADSRTIARLIWEKDYLPILNGTKTTQKNDSACIKTPKHLKKEKVVTPFTKDDEYHAHALGVKL